MKTSIHLVVALLLTISFNVKAQSSDSQKFKWGKQEKIARGYWMNVTRLYNEKKYLEAYNQTSWLLNNSPELNENLYKIADKVYQAKIDATKDKTKLKGLQDTLLFVYDEHIRLYGDKASILNKKGKVAFGYLYESPENHDALYNLYKENYALNKEKTSLKNVLYYFTTSGYMLQKKKMTEEEYLRLYTALNADLETRSGDATVKKVTLINKYQGYIDDELNRNITVDCEFVQSTYGSKFQAQKDVTSANKIQSLMEKNKCVNNDLYIQATEYLIKEEGPNFKNLKTLGNIYNAQDKDDVAYDYFSKALPLAPDDEKAAETHMLLSKIDQKHGKFGDARTHILAAIEKDPTLSNEGHKMIGDMYMITASNQSGDDQVKNRAGYIAAYNEYKKAGESAKMASAKSQFPSMQELFVRNYKVGDQINTGTWMNQTVVLKKRD